MPVEAQNERHKQQEKVASIDKERNETDGLSIYCVGRVC